MYTPYTPSLYRVVAYESYDTYFDGCKGGGRKRKKKTIIRKIKNISPTRFGVCDISDTWACRSHYKSVAEVGNSSNDYLKAWAPSMVALDKEKKARPCRGSSPRQRPTTRRVRMSRRIQGSQMRSMIPKRSKNMTIIKPLPHTIPTSHDSAGRLPKQMRLKGIHSNPMMQPTTNE